MKDAAYSLEDVRMIENARFAAMREAVQIVVQSPLEIRASGRLDLGHGYFYGIGKWPRMPILLIAPATGTLEYGVGTSGVPEIDYETVRDERGHTRYKLGDKLLVDLYEFPLSREPLVMEMYRNVKNVFERK